MFFLFRYNKDGIPYGLIKFHDSFIREIVKYFEKGRQVRRQIREARKAINKAFKLARKKKRKPGVMIDTALGVIRGLNDEIEYTRKALRATHENMENALKQIEQERIEEPITLIESAQELFEKKNFQKGLELLQESREKLNKKLLLKTRTALFSGISSEVKDLKREIEKLKQNKLVSSRTQHS
jgi:seryl-tRNA synthetase